MPRLFWSIASLTAFLLLTDVGHAQVSRGTVPIDALGRDGGARFGNWVVWRYDGVNRSIFVINPKTRWVFYMPWMSNGWANFRTPAGEWNILFSSGAPERRDGAGLPYEKYIDRPMPDR